MQILCGNTAIIKQSVVGLLRLVRCNWYKLTQTLLMKKLPNKFALIKNKNLAGKIMRKLHWDGQRCCPHCGCIDGIIKHQKLKDGIYRYFCGNCDRTFTDLTGTVFEKSKVSLWKWIYGLILLIESTGSISAAELSRNIEVSYTTAWKMLRKIRHCIEVNQLDTKLNGIIESDEAWISHKDNQQIVLGMVERQGKVRFCPILDRKEDQLIYPHYWYVKKGSMVFTDGLISYSALGVDYTHLWVNHSAKEFKRNDVWTNTIEGVWSMLKGIIRTIHHGIKKKYLTKYLALFAFNYNNRHLPLNDKFQLLFKYLCQPRYCLY